jgi:hypothetical protein
MSVGHTSSEDNGNLVREIRLSHLFYLPLFEKMGIKYTKMELIVSFMLGKMRLRIFDMNVINYNMYQFEYTEYV